ncbi:F-box/WD repeat-containing protein 10 [Gouania willdenowi]|uniref:F-box/WD repeat-containing protein 10 n=1 Tax=Gouania willdenowi TaxID=441366 RepID=UPI0010546976|nr:CMT1A duplicated region transcript 1 protein [Gouania willdenowi]
MPSGGCTSMCGLCPSCVFAPERPGCTRVSWTSGDPFRRRFIAALLLRCGDGQLLQSLQNHLSISQCKLFTYRRTRHQDYPAHRARPTSGNQSQTPLGVDRSGIMEWFDRSPTWMKCSYLCRMFLLCDAELLRMASNLTSVLLVQEKCGFMNINGRNQPSEDLDEPALMVVPGSSKSFSGVSRYKDFIRCLPVCLSKRILGLLEAPTLNNCMMVCPYWQRLAQETRKELEFRRSFQEKIKAMMKRRYTMLSPTYAKVIDVLVPMKDEQDEDADSTHPKVSSFEAAYSHVKTRTVQMEERNVYCGLYFTEVLMAKEDRHRVLDYKGGVAMAVTSKDRSVRLLHVASRTEGAGLRGHVGRVRALLLCEDRDLLITGSSDASIRCWSLKTEKCEMTLYGHTGPITCLDVEADTLVSGARDRLVKGWSLKTGKQVKDVTFKHPSPVRCAKINKRSVYSGCERGLVRVWSVEEAVLLRVIDVHRSSVTCLFLDEFHLLSGDSSGKVTAWSKHQDTKECLMTFKHPQEVISLTLLYLRVVTACVDGKIRIFNFFTGDCLKAITAETDAACILSTHFTDNRILVNTSSSVKLYQFADVLWDDDDDDDEDRCEGSVKSAASLKANGKIQERQELLSRSRRQKPVQQRKGLCSGCETVRHSVVMSERAMCERVKKRGPHHPRTRDSMLLTVSAIQREQRMDEVSLNTKSNSRLGYSWGSQDPIESPASIPLRSSDSRNTRERLKSTR